MPVAVRLLAQINGDGPSQVHLKKATGTPEQRSTGGSRDDAQISACPSVSSPPPLLDFPVEESLLEGSSPLSEMQMHLEMQCGFWQDSLVIMQPVDVHGEGSRGEGNGGLHETHVREGPGSSPSALEQASQPRGRRASAPGILCVPHEEIEKMKIQFGTHQARIDFLKGTNSQLLIKSQLATHQYQDRVAELSRVRFFSFLTYFPVTPVCSLLT